LWCGRLRQQGGSSKFSPAASVPQPEEVVSVHDATAPANNQDVSELIRTEIAQLGADLTQNLTKMIQNNNIGGVASTPAGILFLSFCILSFNRGLVS
jgi:hypothetical protein